jgi:hypothetical protein
MSRSYLIFFLHFLYLNKINVISLSFALTTLPLEVKIVPPFGVLGRQTALTVFVGGLGLDCY